jgi:ribonuclease VapC
MIIDTSALIAILRDEPEATACARAIEAASDRCISAANFLEAAIVIDGSHDPIVSRRFDDLASEAQLVIEPVTEVQARIARESFRDFGRGSGHAARLKFRGLLCLCPRASPRRTPAVQGCRFPTHRHHVGAG